MLPVPANLDITLRASAKNGTLVGTKILRGGPNVEEEVILLEPLVIDDATPITIQDQTYTLTVGAVHQYRFDVAAGDPVFVTLGRTSSPNNLQGTILVQARRLRLGPKIFSTSAKLGFFAPAPVAIGSSSTARPASERVSPPGRRDRDGAASSPRCGRERRGVDPAAAVSATFTTALDPTTVTAASITPTFSLFGPLGVVAGTAGASGATATFTPTNPSIPESPTSRA